MTEEYELFRKYQETKDQKIKEELVNRYTYIAKILAYKSTSVGVEYEDLYQVACMGIVLALERFDVDRGVQFATFATNTVMGEIKRFLRDKVRCIRVPRKLYETLYKAEKMRKADSKLSISELSKRLGVSEKTLQEAYKAWDASFIRSLSDEVYSDNDAEMSDMVGYDDDGFTVIENRDFLDYCMAGLDDKEKEVFRHRFFDGKTQVKTAEIMNISQMSVSRTEKKIIEKIKEICINDL